MKSTARKLERVTLRSGEAHHPDYARIRDAVMHKTGVGSAHAMMSVLAGCIIPLLQCPEYTIGDKIR